ncbi:alpha/beta hydrolase [Lewinella sp. 4G2]|uniref:alpha/beta hydrolase n=1 Tax=Lewinella sp. 4G2 TaxID=1803372 RepID=UPI0007B48F65|nr:alpha/beta hydrolase [Lewinella sp. 4G2]OAV45213.1 hypothetical protein A3850_012235 [Lewinella sp. 4G2]
MEQERKEFSWVNQDGQRIVGTHWSIPTPRAVIGVIHGIGEHAGRYDHYVASFNEAGFAVLGYDRVGHGKSEGKRGHAKQYDQLLDEIEVILDQCREAYPGLPVFLYGHSMGGQLLLQYLIQRKPEVSGAIVSAPHIQLPEKPNPFQVGLGRLMRKIKPDFTQPTPLDLSKLSRDPQVAVAYQQDPLVHRQVSAQLGLDLLERAEELNAWTGTLPVPTLMMHGTADGITSHAASEAFSRRNGLVETFKSWPGYYHELHNEPTWPEVAKFVHDWITRQL